MERIDKILSKYTPYSRSEVKQFIHEGRIMVNGKVIDKAKEKVDEDLDQIQVDGKDLKVKKQIYLLLNKPKGYVSATKDNRDETVLCFVPKEYQHRNLFPAGRLDKDTTGLMILTDDGKFAHDILSPKNHVKKTYEVLVDKPLSKTMQEDFEKGVKLNDGICKPAKLEIIAEKRGIVTLTEGRYHQIKRMFGMYQAKVLELKRIAIGNLFLPEDLEEGKCRELSLEELEKIRNR